MLFSVTGCLLEDSTMTLSRVVGNLDTVADILYCRKCDC